MFLKTVKTYEERIAFVQARSERQYSDIVDVKIFTPYADGIMWDSTASENAKIITGCLSDDDSDNAILFESKSDWPCWVKAIGVPSVSSLSPAQWVND